MATTKKKTTANKVNTTKKVNYTYNPTKETATQYNARIASERGDTAKELKSMQNATQTAFKEKGLDVNKLTSTSLTPNAPYVAPEKPIPENTGNLVAAGNAGVVTGMENATLDENSLIQRLDNGTLTQGDALRYALENQPQAPNAEKMYLKSKEYRATQDAQKQVNDYTAQLNQITAQSNAQQLALEGQGRGQTEAFVGGEQARINREAAIAALPIQAQLAAAQGNLEFAQKQLDTVFTLRMEDARNKYKYETDKLNSIVSFLDKAETRQYNERMKQEERKYNDEQKAIQMAMQVGNDAISYGQGYLLPQLANAKTAAEVFKIQAQLRKPVETTKLDTAFDKDGNLVDMQTGEILRAAGGGVMDEKKKEQINETLTLARELLSDDTAGKSGAIGFGFQKFVPFGQSLGLQGDRTAFENKVNTLKANLTLENLGLLKGPMSDKDLAFLQAIGSSLSTNMSEKEFNTQVKKIVQKLEEKAFPVNDKGTRVVTAPDGLQIEIID